MLQGAEVSLFLIIGIPTLLFMLFPDSLYIASICDFFIILYVIMCGCSYVILQCFHVIIVIIQLVQVTFGLACIRGVFSSRIFIAGSRRDSVSEYFGKQDLTRFFFGIRAKFLSCDVDF